MSEVVRAALRSLEQDEEGKRKEWSIFVGRWPKKTPAVPLTGDAVARFRRKTGRHQSWLTQDEHGKHVIFYRETNYGMRVTRILQEPMLPYAARLTQ